MLYNNRNYPHPVLGVADDYLNSQLQVDLKISSRLDYIEITPIFILENKDISRLIQENQATYVSHVYCRGTLYREVFKTAKSLADPILIPSVKLNGEVEIDFFVCASTSISSFKSSAFNPDYNQASFDIDKSDIVAYAGKGKFYANKRPQELKSISALMNIDCTGEHLSPMYLDYSGEKITIMLCVEDYNNYKLFKSNKQYFGLILSSLVFPALLEALHFLNDPTAKDYAENKWYKALKEIKDASKKHAEPIRIAQNILDQPLNRCFESITTDYDYE